MNANLKLFLTPVMVFLALQLTGQETIRLGFEAGVHIDSVRVENLDTGHFCLLAGTDSMVFQFDTEEKEDTSTVAVDPVGVMPGPVIYPNPCSGQARFQFASGIPTWVVTTVYDFAGKQLGQLRNNVAPGNHSYGLFLDQPGLHLVTVTTTSGACTSPVINLGGGMQKLDIAYEGPSGSQKLMNASGAERGHKSYKISIDTTNTLQAAKGDLLRICAYSDSSMEMKYDYLERDTIYFFHFPEVERGTYLQVSEGPVFLPDTIYCFAGRTGYRFEEDTSGSVVSGSAQIFLQPVTFGGKKQPIFTWEIGDREVWSIDTSAYGPGVLLPLIPRAGTYCITLHDLANGFSREYILVMEAEDFAGNGIALTKIRNQSTLDEISGMAASIKNPGCFWVHNDSGDKARLFLINTGGYIVATVTIDTEFTDNRDWEDIAVGPGPAGGESYVYIGEIGDLDRKYTNKYIFRITEPAIDTSSLNQRFHVARDSVFTITFDYADGSRDAEILLIDPETKDLFVITKREERVQIYELPYPQNFEEKVILTRSAVTLPFRLTNGGDISADGKEILVKNLTHVYYWKRKEGESVIDALSRPGEKLPYIKEPQGESIAWFRDGSAYLTVSEKKDGITPVIYKYVRRW